MAAATLLGQHTARGAAFHTRQIKEVPLWTGITPRLKRVCGCLIPCSPPRFRLAAGRAAPHRFCLAASRIPTTRARGQGLTLPPGAAERAASPRVAQLVVAPVPAGPSPESDIGRSPALAVTRARLRPPAPAHSGPATPTLRPRRRRSDHRVVALGDVHPRPVFTEIALGVLRGWTCNGTGTHAKPVLRGQGGWSEHGRAGC
jgi:hypothetical protein